MVFGVMFFLAIVLFFLLMPAGFTGVPYVVFAIIGFILVSSGFALFVDIWTIHAAAISAFWFTASLPGLIEAWQKQSITFFFREYGFLLFIYVFHMLIQCGASIFVKGFKTQND